MKSTKFSELFPIKLTVRRLPIADNFSGRQTPPLDRNFLRLDRVQSSLIMSLRTYKCRTFNSLQKTHPLQPT